MDRFIGCAYCGHDDFTRAFRVSASSPLPPLICAKCRLPWEGTEYRTACGHKVDDCTCNDPYEAAEERYRKFCAASSRAWRSLGTEEGTYNITMGISVDGVDLPNEFVGYMAAAIQEKWTYLLSDAERIARRSVEIAREEGRRANGCTR